MGGARKETHLGDGLYASFDGYQIVLRTLRENGNHVVYLEPGVFQSLVDFAGRIWGRPAEGAPE